MPRTRVIAMVTALAAILVGGQAAALESGQTCDDGYEEFVASGETWTPAPELWGLPDVDVPPGS